MKVLFCIVALLFGLSVHAQGTFTVETSVVVRDAKFEARIFKRALEGLLSRDRVEGLYFKVVEGKSDEAVSFSADSGLVLRAATTYYHLMKARDFFVDKIGSEFVQKMAPIVVRINLTNQYNDLGHFANDNLEPQFNNALTVPAGTGLAGRGIKPWGTEIWFRPMKKVHVSELKVKDDGLGSWGAVLSEFRDQNRMTTLQRFLAQFVQSQTNELAPAITLDSVIRTGGTSLLLELFVGQAEPIARTFSQKWYRLDTALVPEIIYHEFAHVALSDELVLSHSTAVIEGMADFFAGQIANSPKLALDIKKYNTFNGKKATRKTQYQVQFEATDYANSDFVFGMLWDLKSIVGEEKSNQFIYSLRERIETSDSIRKQLIEGILDTCEELCSNPFVDKLKILKRYNKRGI